MRFSPVPILSRQSVLVYSQRSSVCLLRLVQSFTSAAYMAWIKQHIQNGHPVLIGVFINQFMDHNDTVRAFDSATPCFAYSFSKQYEI